MSTSESIVVVHPGEGMPSQPLPDTPMQKWQTGWSGWIQNDAGDVSGWHHHVANDTYVYVSRGSLTIEFGPGGTERVVAGPGDFFHVPAHTIHRELTGEETDLEAFILRVGGEPEYAQADGPDPAAD